MTRSEIAFFLEGPSDPSKDRLQEVVTILRSTSWTQR